MIAVDTNIVVRLLVNDPTAQAQVALAKALLKRAKYVYVPQIVQVETVWVLEKSYQFDKAAVLTALKHLQKSPLFILQHKAQFDAALATFATHHADFSDCLILSDCLENTHQLFTFDRKFARLQAVTLLNEKQFV
ncbi:PIN domain-containing protein [Methylovulum psychrotolerans]|jgi:predicted nucleic-acid-binding protein|uniref:PIN domain-containing protein n=1 Tax=Methylovulum psychrotolerans TaxID=1704499 RepID=A0A2S5CQ08_9GAMM|nr:type II toxin-antitoxin system VapC family toxin [Methylovulum psychrotolerans]POZ52883.1 PIN domain-containing protein [Methylovulum psychrotolerans]